MSSTGVVMTLFPNDRATASTVLKGEDVINLPIADLVGQDEPLVPIDRVDQLFAESGAVSHTDDAGTNGSHATAGNEHDQPAPDIDPEAVFQAGWDAGRREAMAAIEAERRADASMVDSVVRALASVEAAIDRAGSARKEASVELALELARLVLDRELAVAVNPGRDALARCLSEVPIAKRAVFRFHPDDLARLGDGDELLAGRPCELMADPTVKPGDVLVDIDGGLIDGGIANALERVAEVLRA